MLFPHNKLILSLCDYSGNWPKFYKEAGYEVVAVDLKKGMDVRTLHYLDYLNKPVYGILTAPPCTAFAGSCTTAVAAEKLGRKWIMIEISEQYCEVGAKRIERERSQLKLSI